MSKPLIFFNKSTDIINNRIANRTIVDSYVLLHDTGVWKIVENDLTLGNTTNPTLTVDDNPDVDIAGALPIGNNTIGRVIVRNNNDTANINPLAESTFVDGINSVVGALEDLLTDISLNSGTDLIGKMGIDQTTDGATNKVHATQNEHDDLNTNANMQVNNMDVSDTNPVKVKGGASKSSVSKTRPNIATPYSIGDVVGTDAATNLEFTSVSNIPGGYVVITGASLEIDVNAVPSGMSSFRLHLYDAAPTAITDNLAYNLPSADRAKYLGYIEIYTPSDLGDTLWSRVDNVNLLVKLANGSTTLYGMLETRGAFIPTAQCGKVVTLNTLEV